MFGFSFVFPFATMIPLAVIAFFVVSLVMYVSRMRKSKNIPVSVSPSGITVWLVLTVISAVLLGLMIFLFVIIVILLSGSISFM